MKTLTIIMMFSFIIALNVKAQVIRPVFDLVDKPGATHNAHITSDGQFYYTCNGGATKEGTPKGIINKYTLSGDLIQSYAFTNYDMRSIMFNNKDKHFYIATFDFKIYRIVDLDNGTTQLLFENLYTNPQSSIALDPKGKIIYVMESGTLTMYKTKDGSVIKTLSGLSYGADDKPKSGSDDILKKGKYGSTAVAVDNNYIYTWDSHSDSREIYAYDKYGVFIKSFKISDGNWGYTLSYANGYVFVATDGNGKIGTWYGYKLWESVSN
jgi:6-phosphogluconolactonase (cycloisomerase 2 family)